MELNRLFDQTPTYAEQTCKRISDYCDNQTKPIERTYQMLSIKEVLKLIK